MTRRVDWKGTSPLKKTPPNHGALELRLENSWEFYPKLNVHNFIQVIFCLFKLGGHRWPEFQWSPERFLVFSPGMSWYHVHKRTPIWESIGKVNLWRVQPLGGEGNWYVNNSVIRKQKVNIDYYIIQKCQQLCFNIVIHFSSGINSWISYLCQVIVIQPGGASFVYGRVVQSGVTWQQRHRRSGCGWVNGKKLMRPVHDCHYIVQWLQIF